MDDVRYCATSIPGQVGPLPALTLHSAGGPKAGYDLKMNKKV